MDYKVGEVIDNECWECGRAQMKVYRVHRQEGGMIVWCVCESCDARDDMIIYFDTDKKT